LADLRRHDPGPRRADAGHRLNLGLPVQGSPPRRTQNGLLGSNLKHYAWAWLIVGIILIVSSVLILTRSQFARWIGYIAAVIVALSAMTWMPYYPIWSITYIGVAVLVFYALAAHGGREAA
jgi:hypothetical protein